MENVTIVMREDKLVIDAVLATLCEESVVTDG
jgi:hypothetical protein